MNISLHTTQTSAPNTAVATSVSPLEQSGSSKTKFSQTRTDIYQTITDNIIVALEAGVKPWSCPWQRVSGMSGLPSNFATGIAYSGINIMLLWCSASKQGFDDSRWMTYKQAQAVGGQVRKGEHGTTAIFYTTLEKENEDGEIDRIPMLKTFNVFNIEQIDGLPLTTETVSSEETFDPLPEAENLFRNSGANIIEQGQNAFFQPSTDEVWLPKRQLFSDAPNFYATALHELVHWSGGKGRLNRKIKGKFGSEDYAFEELIAELGSAFLMADLGMVGEVQHESYIASWLNALKNDKRYIFKAASAASKAHRYLMDKA
ncbi:zincin-like metallopeptidase domain-containing protein [Pectobacterium peruviense]|uniref:ArdC family protein n=1 Tax=Pectobacterium peruviense TaxID=2066479 RepID=UPI000DE4B8D6|nr:zincin-like metallopeptidase domain-containing protein [Pectobacterium peruviense]